MIDTWSLQYFKFIKVYLFHIGILSSLRGGVLLKESRALTNALIEGVYSFHIFVPCPIDFF